MKKVFLKTTDMSSRTKQSADARTSIGQRPRIADFGRGHESTAGKPAGASPFNAEIQDGVPAACPALRCGGDMWGFTLAEVLITLGIIGIIAAITIPALIANYQKKVYETANLVFENRLGEALRQMNIAEDLTGYTETEDFVTALKKYMKIIKVCEHPNAHACFADKIGASGESVETNIIQTSSNFVNLGENWETDVVGIVLQNGTSALLAYNPGCQSSGIAAKADELRSCIAITYDTNGKKQPNEYGKDLGGDMAGKVFLVKLSDNLWMTAEDMVPPLIDGSYWIGATKICEDLGMKLPSNGQGITTTVGYCPGGINTQNNSLFAASQACQIFNWCKTSGNTCSDMYWLAEDFPSQASSAAMLYWDPQYRGLVTYGYEGASQIRVRCVKSP